MAKIGEVLSKIKEVFVGRKLSPAEKVLAEIGGSRRNVKNVLSGGVAEDEKSAKEKQAEREAFVKELAYVEGDSENGPKKSVRLSENDLIEMGDLGISYSYLNDVLFGRAVQGGDMVKLVFPDGMTGTLYIRYFPKNGAVEYTFRKDCARLEDEARAA